MGKNNKKLKKTKLKNTTRSIVVDDSNNNDSKDRYDSDDDFEFSHLPVLPKEVIDGLAIKPDGIYVDGTLGGGGHSSLICEQLSAEGTLLGIDQDEEAIKVASERLQTFACHKIYAHANYEEIDDVLAAHGIDKIDGALLDIGVSSYQLDNPARGFSYMHDAPLDMRMDAHDDLYETSDLTAYKIVNEYSEDELERIMRTYGEERWARRIAKFIVEAREEHPIESTDALTEVIKKAIPKSARRDGPHPSKRTFQSIRIEVNGELDVLSRAINRYIDRLNSGGRLAIITFHSLEDRIVKELFLKRENPCTCDPLIPICTCGNVADAKRITRKPIVASEEELAVNHRSRSAKLRIIEKQ